MNKEIFKHKGRTVIIDEMDRQLGMVDPDMKFEEYTAPTARVVDEDVVNHPKHYTSNPSGIEAIQICEHMNFNLGNVIKYVFRAGVKSKDTLLEDLKKAQWYLKREIERLEK